MTSSRERVSGARRIIARACVFVLLGAMVNVAVAWGCAVFIDLRNVPEQFNVTHDPVSETWIADTRRDGFGVSQSIRREVMPSTYGVTSDHYILEIDAMASPIIVLEPGETIEREGQDKHRTAGTSGHQHFLTLEPWTNFCGWPMPSMRCWLENQSGYPSSLASARRGPVRLVAGIDLSGGKIGPDSRALPLQPMWLGFAINTLFYATILWMLFAAVLALRRRRRMKRGLCPACAYPVGTSPVCTECGAPVNVRSVDPTSST